MRFDEQSVKKSEKLISQDSDMDPSDDMDTFDEDFMMEVSSAEINLDLPINPLSADYTEEKKVESGVESENKEENGVEAENKEENGVEAENEEENGVESENKEENGVESENEKLPSERAQLAANDEEGAAENNPAANYPPFRVDLKKIMRRHFPYEIQFNLDEKHRPLVGVMESVGTLPTIAEVLEGRDNRRKQKLVMEKRVPDPPVVDLEEDAESSSSSDSGPQIDQELLRDVKYSFSQLPGGKPSPDTLKQITSALLSTAKDVEKAKKELNFEVEKPTEYRGAMKNGYIRHEYNLRMRRRVVNGIVVDGEKPCCYQKLLQEEQTKKRWRLLYKQHMFSMFELRVRSWFRSRPSECHLPRCGASNLIYPFSRIQHLQMEHGLEMIRCKICNSHFYMNRQFRTHCRLHHPESFPKSVLYRCTKCKSGFPSYNRLKNHYNRVHLGVVE